MLPVFLYCFFPMLCSSDERSYCRLVCIVCMLLRGVLCSFAIPRFFLVLRSSDERSYCRLGCIVCMLLRSVLCSFATPVGMPCVVCLRHFIVPVLPGDLSADPLHSLVYCLNESLFDIALSCTSAKETYQISICPPNRKKKAAFRERKFHYVSFFFF